jgi:hypothetical protein
MTRQTRSKIGEVLLVLVFCILSLYITLAGTVFVGTPSVLTVAQRLMILRPCIKRNGAVDGKLAPNPCSSEEVTQVTQMGESPGRYET